MVASEELYFYVTNRLEGKQLKASTMYIEDYMSKARFVGEIIGQLSMKMDLPKKFVEMYE